MALNLNVLAGTVAQKMYSISIDGVNFGELTEVDTEKLIGIIKGMQSGVQSNNITVKNLAPAPQQSAKQSKDSKDFPNLGTPSAVVGDFVTVYNDTMVRYWEKNYCPDKVKGGIKHSLKEAGAEWDKPNGCFTFKTKKACAEWVKAQKNRK